MTITLNSLQVKLVEQDPTFQADCEAYLKTNPDDINKSNPPLLSLAAKSADAEYAVSNINFLIAHKADVFCNDPNRYSSPLASAIMNAKNPAPIVHCLLMHGADPTAIEKWSDTNSMFDTAALLYPGYSKYQTSSPFEALLRSEINPKKVLKVLEAEIAPQTKQHIQDILKKIEAEKENKTKKVKLS